MAEVKARLSLNNSQFLGALNQSELSLRKLKSSAGLIGPALRKVFSVVGIGTLVGKAIELGVEIERTGDKSERSATKFRNAWRHALADTKKDIGQIGRGLASIGLAVRETVELNRLNKLLKQGKITWEEYNAERDKLYAREEQSPSVMATPEEIAQHDKSIGDMFNTIFAMNSSVSEQLEHAKERYARINEEISKAVDGTKVKLDLEKQGKQLEIDMMALQKEANREAERAADEKERATKDAEAAILRLSEKEKSDRAQSFSGMGGFLTGSMLDQIGLRAAAGSAGAGSISSQQAMVGRSDLAAQTTARNTDKLYAEAKRSNDYLKTISSKSEPTI